MKWKINSLCCAALAGAAMLPLSVRADTKSDWNNCENNYGDVAINACTSLIESGSVTGVDLAEAFFRRGRNYASEEDYTHAIEDDDQAIKLKPDFAEAFFDRGNDYFSVGDYARAISEFDETIALKPDFGSAYNSRGLAKKAIGDEAGGDADIETYNRWLAQSNR
jgi:tetratricopeptide (TPR) repeat protein